ncbi:MAG: uncharacterized protein KVP18_001095 [Porospora cf. gigantea A]|uniref:uncharacterized protein n=1 Tax=Porospora cf. gigantea A TaxID=2853593 RepID=UPI00355A6656|nr:MAG: hypothetical protein KVP18_001095 [Porospora cf. gigantea A]
MLEQDPRVADVLQKLDLVDDVILDDQAVVPVNKTGSAGVVWRSFVPSHTTWLLSLVLTVVAGLVCFTSGLPYSEANATYGSILVVFLGTIGCAGFLRLLAVGMPPQD